MTLDPHACYRAVRARDPRFDGRLFVAVRTTKIYCRPICPTRTPKFENMEFYRSAAAAQNAGFRPCLRCRPEASPDLAVWRGSSNTVSRALALIADGALDNGASVDALAARLGVGERQLRRLFKMHLGASPIAVAQTRRVLFAKQLIHDTPMRMTDVALASGFGSLRRFNDTFRTLYRRSPSNLRRDRASVVSAGEPAGITLLLGYRPPYDWRGIVDFLGARAIPGVELVEAERYLRTIGLGGRQGTIEVRPAAERNALALTIRFPDVKAFASIVERVKRVFDLGADIGTISGHLRSDPDLSWRLGARPGLRVPGAWDGFELAVRAVLGQQITVVAARQLAGKLVARFGTPLEPVAQTSCTELCVVFPTATSLMTAEFAVLGMPQARARTLATLAAEVASDPGLFNADRDPAVVIDRLKALPGIGEWTAQYVAMRALREPDAFPAADIGLQRALMAANGRRPSAGELLSMAERWRPWRAYAAQYLWTCGARRELAASPRQSEVAV